MRPPRQLSVLGIVAGIVALSLVAPAAAGSPAPKVEFAKKSAGPYSEYIKKNVPDGETKPAYLRVRSKADANQPATLTDAYLVEPGPDYTVKWFQGKKNITSDMNDEGYEFTLKPDKDRIFKTKIKAPEGAQGICITASVEVPNLVFSNASIDVNGETCIL